MTCPSCGTSAVAGAAFCRDCGTALAPMGSQATAELAPNRQHDTRQATQELVGRTCPFCRFPIKQDGLVTECACCHAVHHGDCFADNGGCAVAGCQAGPGGIYAPAPVITPVPTAATAIHPHTLVQAAVPPAPPGAGMADGFTAPAMAPPPPPPPGPPPAGGAPRRGGAWKAAAISVAVIAALGGAGAALAIALTGRKVQTRTVAYQTPVPQPTDQQQTTPQYTANDSTQNTDPTNTTTTTTTPPDPAPVGGSAPVAHSSSSGGGSTSDAPGAGEGPTQVLKEHFTDLGDGNADGAFALMTPSYRAANPNWPSERSAANPTIQIVSAGPAQVTSSTTADVPIDFYAQDANSTQGSDTSCREFSGTAHMEKLQGLWRYDPAGGALNSAVMPDSVCSG